MSSEKDRLDALLEESTSFLEEFNPPQPKKKREKKHHQEPKVSWSRESANLQTGTLRGSIRVVSSEKDRLDALLEESTSFLEEFNPPQPKKKRGKKHHQEPKVSWSRESANLQTGTLRGSTSAMSSEKGYLHDVLEESTAFLEEFNPPQPKKKREKKHHQEPKVSWSRESANLQTGTLRGSTSAMSSEKGYLHDVLEESTAFLEEFNPPQPKKKREKKHHQELKFTWRQRDIRGRIIPQTTRPSTSKDSGIKETREREAVDPSCMPEIDLALRGALVEAGGGQTAARDRQREGGEGKIVMSLWGALGDVVSSVTEGVTDIVNAAIGAEESAEEGEKNTFAAIATVMAGTTEVGKAMVNVSVGLTKGLVNSVPRAISEATSAANTGDAVGAVANILTRSMADELVSGVNEVSKSSQMVVKGVRHGIGSITQK
ncbi:uncharacterized protein LOC116219977 isoform X2 [Clupea harengus]|uniref:Uncharacterized protein LOC116219977 isoform X2 n=1 Tax=Clupea harengus TaxID=7950 RepID=A0A6P8F9H4_CLUHA|nr:uncharacterized protein LOC116219977 isoform X2 [Clupea harengus]